MSSEGGISTVSLKSTPSTPFGVVGGGCSGREDDGDADPVGVVAGDEASAPAAADASVSLKSTPSTPFGDTLRFFMSIFVTNTAASATAAPMGVPQNPSFSRYANISIYADKIYWEID